MIGVDQASGPDATINYILEMREALRPFLIPFGAPMTTRDIIENAKGLISAAKDSQVIPPPWRLVLPVGTNLLELVQDGEQKRPLVDVLSDIPDVKSVLVSEDSNGLSIETFNAPV